MSAGLTAASGHAVDPNDLGALREALAYHEALARSREEHLGDMREELRRLHERVADLTGAVASRASTEPWPPRPPLPPAQLDQSAGSASDEGGGDRR